MSGWLEMKRRKKMVICPDYWDSKDTPVSGISE
jgi:hypothetical protein